MTQNFEFWQRMKNAVMVFAGVATLFSCWQSDPNPGNTFFTLTLADRIPANSWLFATDKLGNVLDVQPAAGTIYLRSSRPVPDSVSITILHPFADGSCRLSTFTGIPKNSIFQENGDGLPPTELQAGNATITVSDCPDGDLTFSDGYFFTIGKYDADLHTSSQNLYLIQGFDSILVSGYNGSTPVYRWFPKVVNGDAIHASFSSFLAYPKTMTVQFDGAIAGYVSGLTSHNPYQGGFCFGHLSTFISPANIGYLEGYSSYSSYLRLLGADGATVVYEKTGTITPHLTIPAFEFKAIDTRINNLKFSFSGDYTYYCGTWSKTSTPSVTWEVFTEETMIPGAVSIPAEISSRFPALRLESLQYAGVDFTKLLDGSTFNDFAKKLLSTRSIQPGERITYSYR